MGKITLAGILFVFLLSSCALRPIPSEYNFVQDLDEVELEELGSGKVLIYNAANLLHKVDNTARLNVWINDKGLGQIRPGEYVIVTLENGEHQFKLLHIDVFNMRSEHIVTIEEGTKVIEIRPTLTSNELEVTNVLPNKFERFDYAQKR